MSVSLRSAFNFAILAGSSITNTGTTVVNGDIGLYPGTSYTGGGTITLTGSTHITDTIAEIAQADLTAAYIKAAAAIQTDSSNNYTDLSALTLTPGVYKGTSSLSLTGTLTLNGPGTYIFQAGSSLIFGSGATVVLENGACADNIFWQVTSSATLGTTSILYGNILALSSITLNNGAIIYGRALARNGAVTLIGNTINNTFSSCTSSSSRCHCRSKPRYCQERSLAKLYSQQISIGRLDNFSPSCGPCIGTFRGNSNCCSSGAQYYGQ